jgi:hypothetical protein
MDFEAYFIILFIVVAIYVIFGNYLYFRKVIPGLDTTPGLLPSTQVKHMQLYLEMLQETGERPWFLFYLENIKTITLVIALLMVPGFLHVFGFI